MNNLTRFGWIVAALIALQACTVSVPITAPNLSSTPFETGDSSANSLALIDALEPEYEVSQGPLPLKVTYQDAPLDAAFFFDNLSSELSARDLNVQTGGESDNRLTLRDFSILHHRVSGFSPMVTISTFSAELATPSGSQRVAAMVKRAKVPVWSMDEINDPCFNEPIELLIKEMAAKINQVMVDGALDDETVQSLVTKVNNELASNELSYMDVYELGFSNNPAAIPALYEFSKNEREYIRLAGISGLGTLRSAEHLDYLKNIYTTSSMWSDRGMALKAIGDIGSDDALSFLAEVRDNFDGDSSNEGQWNLRIIDLYLGE